MRGVVCGVSDKWYELWKNREEQFRLQGFIRGRGGEI